MVEVTQEDRDAALPILLHLYAYDALPIKREQFRAEIHAGGQDKHYIVQALARHRLAAHPHPTGDVGALVERLEPVAWLYECGMSRVVKDCRQPHFQGYTETPLYPAATILALTAEVERVKEALVQHNDRLRSAAQVADREGRDTNWLSFRGHLHYTLAEYHELTNAARAAIGKAET